MVGWVYESERIKLVFGLSAVILLLLWVLLLLLSVLCVCVRVRVQGQREPGVVCCR